MGFHCYQRLFKEFLNWTYKVHLMRSITVSYGRGNLSATIAEEIDLNIIDPKTAEISESLDRLLITSFHNPIGSEKIVNLYWLVRGGDRGMFRVRI